MIKLSVFDFDGCFTNGKVFIDNNGCVIKHYNVKDGTGISLLKKNNIKVCIISGYKKNKSQLEIIKHLKLDYYSFENNNKFKYLKELCLKLNINLETEVSYMGDDINDIDVLENVKFNGCPKNAHKEVLNICNFISSKDGGNGCIREFCDYLILNERCVTNQSVIKDMKKEMYYQLENINIECINKLAIKINRLITNNNIYLCGVGKSECISIHCCTILKSIGINAFNLNILNSIHGDIGSIKENDLILLFSKSGNTKEIIDLLPYLKQKKCEIIGICCNKNSKFIDLCDDTILLPFISEIKCNVDCLPTNSIMVFIFFINILVYEMCNILKLDKSRYKLNHPAGNIGNSLKQIKDIIITDYPKIELNNTNANLSTIFLEMTKYKMGCSFFVNNNDELLGILTDGDIRRLLLNKSDLKEISMNDLNTNFYYENDDTKYINMLKSYNYIPILNELTIIGIVIL